MVRVVIFATLLLLASLRVSASTFPRPPALEPAVSFWVKVYTQISTQQGFIHDDENLSVIYQSVFRLRLLGANETSRSPPRPSVSGTH